MDASIWVAIITSLASFCGVLVTVRNGNKKYCQQSKELSDLTLYRIGELEKKQDKYNHLQERMNTQEKSTAVMQETISDIGHRIERLENKE